MDATQLWLHLAGMLLCQVHGRGHEPLMRPASAMCLCKHLDWGCISIQQNMHCSAVASISALTLDGAPAMGARCMLNATSTADDKRLIQPFVVCYCLLLFAW